MTKPLSLAAQAVQDAGYAAFPESLLDGVLVNALAAALRAAALYCKRDTLQLLAIADELEGNA